MQRALVDPDVSDRSVACARVIGACVEAGLTPGQTLSVVAGYGPAQRYKNAKHMADDVARFHGKALTDRTARRNFDDLVASDVERGSASVAEPARRGEGPGGTKKEESPAVDPPAPSAPPPVASPAVYRGLLGEIVLTVDGGPHTEADPVGVLVTLLAGAGALLGRAPHVQIASTRHPLLVWPLLFGATGTGRKGESASTARLFLDPAQEFGRIAITGLSSGEGLIERIRDPRDEDDPGGTEDKRLFVLEPEFAGVMARAKREGSTLSTVLRQAWDGGRLSVMNRAALVASNSHVAVIGHITPREFRLRAAETDMSGGTYNRFLPIFVDRHKRLPLPEPIPPSRLVQLGSQLAAAIGTASEGIRQVTLDAGARRLWAADLYDEFTGTDDDDHVSVEFTRRAAPYCQRIAALHTVLDGRHEISRDDLHAAAELVRYAIGSARYLLDRQLRDPRLDRIRRAVIAVPDGLNRTDVSALFSRNLPKATLDALLVELVGDGKFEAVEVRTGGRPATRYRHRAVSSSFVPDEPPPDEEPAPAPLRSVAPLRPDVLDDLLGPRGAAS